MKGAQNILCLGHRRFVITDLQTWYFRFGDTCFKENAALHRLTVTDRCDYSSCVHRTFSFLLQLADVKSLPSVRELVRLRPREGDHHLALTHWILSSKSFAVKTLQKEEVHHYV